MANLGNLWFTLGLSTDKFKQEIKSSAVDLNELKEKIKALGIEWNSLGKTDATRYKVAVKLVSQIAQEQEKVTRETQKTANAQKEANKQLSSQSNLVKNLANYAKYYVNFFAAQRLVSSLVNITGEFEQQRIALKQIIGDVMVAEGIYNRIKALAVESPFEFKELVNYTKQLTAFSVPAGELYDTMKMLADVSAGLGVGMDRLVLAYGQIRSASFLRGQEVRQLTEAGVPILEELRKQFEAMGEIGITAGQVFDKISQRQVTFEMVKKVFVDMTSEGGKFYKMQEVLADSLKGKISNLKDAYQIMMSEIGERHSEGLKNTVDWMRKLMQNADSLGSNLVALVKTWGAYKAATAIVKMGELIYQFGSLSKAIQHTTIAQKILNSTLLSNPYILIATAIASIIAYLQEARISANALNDSLVRVSESKFFEADKLTANFDKLVEKLRSSAQGSIAYGDAIRKLNSQYSDYLPNILNEANALDTVNASYQRVIDSIKKKAQAEAYSAGMQKIEQEYGESQREYLDKFYERLNSKGISTRDARAMIQLYNERVKSIQGEFNPADLFNEVYQSYFGTGEKLFSGIGRFLNTLKQSTPFIRNIYNVNESGWQTASDALFNYSLAFTAQLKQEEKFNDYLTDRSGRMVYNSAEERKQIEAINNEYENRFNEIDRTEKQADALIHKHDLEILKLYEIKKVYESFERIDMVNSIDAQIKELEKVPTGWVSIVTDAIKKSGLELRDGIGAIQPQENASWYEYVDGIREGYDDIKKKIRDAGEGNKEQIPTLTKVKELYEEIFKLLNLQSEKETKEKSGGTKPQRVTDLEQEYQIVKTIIDQYNKLKIDYSERPEKEIVDVLQKAWGSKMKTTDFVKWVNDIVGELNTLGSYGEETAKRILNKDDIQEGTAYIAKVTDQWRNEAKAIKEAQKAFEKYMTEMAKWEAQDFTISGTGALFDLSKTLRDLKTKENELQIQELENLNELEAAKSQMSKEQYNAEIDRIERLYSANIAYERKLTAEKIKELGKRYGQDAVKDNTKIKTKDYGDLSLGQIRTSIYELNQLLSMTDSQIAGLLSDEDRKKLKDAGLSLRDFIDAYREYLRLKEQDNETEAFKKVLKSAKKTTQYISTLSSSLANLGKANGKNGIDEIAYGLDKMVEATDIILDSLEEMTGAFSEVTDEAADLADSISKSADWVTMIVKIVVFAGKMLMDTLAKQDEDAIRYQQAMAQVNTELARYRYESNLAAGVDTLFGEDSVQKLKNYSGEISRLEKEIRKWSNAVKDILPLEDSMFFSWHQNSKMLEELRKKGVEIFDENGLLNSNFEEYLKMMEASGWDYAGGYDELIEMIKEYNEALEGLKESIQGVFGELSSNIADSWLDAWDEMGRITEDSAKNIDNIVNDLGRDIAKSLIQNVVLSPILAQYEDELYNIYKKYGTSGNEQEFIDSLGLWSGSLKDAIQMGTDSANMILQSLEKAGVYDRALTEGSDTLKSSIQGITEETASRVANLLNGIYSESFRQGALMDELLMYVGAMDIAGINDNLNLGLVELQAINANTRDTAAHAGAMRELMNNLTTYGGQTAMNVRLLN